MTEPVLLDDTQLDSDRARPLLRWAGSKRKLLPLLASLIPTDFNRYIEPFAGSACLFFNIAPQKALLSDINEELINTYKQVKANPDKVTDTLEGIPDRSASIYYQVRALNPALLDDVTRAARFIYLNRLCFNGLYRTNAKGEFNVPFGGEKTGALPSRRDICATSQALRRARLFSGSFEEILSEAEPNDFFYLDPPYSISNRRVFNNYSNDVFGIKKLKQLSRALKRIDRLGVRFLLSYGLSKEGLQLAEGFKTHHALVQRQISGFAAHRRKARELLITNY